MRQYGRIFEVELRLHAIAQDVPPTEVAAFYKANETQLLDVIFDRSPWLRLGTTEVVIPENRDRRGPVGRVDDLLNGRGTSTSPHQLPLLDRALMRDLLATLAPQPHDPRFDVIPLSQLTAFLLANIGSRLATTSRPTP